MKTRTALLAAICLVAASPCFSIGPRPQVGTKVLSGQTAHYFASRPDIIDVPPLAPTVRTADVCAVLVLLVDFDDMPAEREPAHFDELLFGDGDATMRAYFEENSYGGFTVIGDVYGWFRSRCLHGNIVNRDHTAGTIDDFGLDTSPAAVDASVCDMPLNIWGLAAHTVELAAEEIDFSLYDNDGPDGVPDSGDDDGYVDALLIVHSGIGAELFGDASRIWSLQSDLDKYGPTKGTSAQGVRIGPFVLVPEMGEIGVFAHEFCHLLGLPDLYNSETGASVVGSLCLMDKGAWNGPLYRPGSVPSHLCAPMKHILGWVDPIEVCLGCDGVEALEGAAIEPHGGSGHPYLILDNPGAMDWTPDGTGSGEYFMLENRQQAEGYFETYLPGSGLVVWKFDESRPNNNNPERRLAEVVQADGEVVNPAFQETEDPRRHVPGEPDDFWPGTLNKRDFTPLTEPASTLSGGRFSGVSVTNISRWPLNNIGADIRVGLPKKGVSYAFPNPHRLSDGSPMRIIFLPDPGPDTPHEGSFAVTIFDLEGNLIRNLDTPGEILEDGTALWNGEDESGNRVEPGLYFYSAKSSGQEATGLLGIKR